MWAEVGGVAGAVAMVGVIVQALVGAFQAGRRAQRLERAEEDIQALNRKVEGIGAVQVAIGTLTGTISAIQGQVERLATDVQAALRERA
jgi:hypothetical protein